VQTRILSYHSTRANADEILSFGTMLSPMNLRCKISD
jgi:hypothetical protein